MFGPGESPLFQPLAQHPDARPVKADNFETGVASIAEHKQRATFEVFAQSFGHQGVQTIEAFALIPISE